ncbi:MAG: hypothetical protein P1V51_04700 [Deltaproteobacteria bacterium]|nr:hypothetical protein [Deltaproteobacteria bacterium]
MNRIFSLLALSSVLILAAGCFPSGDDDDDGRRDGSVSDGGGSDGGGTDGGGVNCGNGTIDLGEDCEAGNLNGASCQSLGYGGGSLFCTGCLFDEGSCTSLETCNNGQLDTMEACEGFELRGETCQSQGRPGGTLTCSPNCTLDLSGCSRCGDGMIGQGEACDGANFNGQTCETMNGTGWAGNLTCLNNCTSIDAESNCFYPTQRDEGCTLGQTGQCAPGTTCTPISPFDRTSGTCMIPCPASSVGQSGGVCPGGEVCLETGSSEPQPANRNCSANSDCDPGYVCLSNGSGTQVCGRFITACGNLVPLAGDYSSSGAWNNGQSCSLDPYSGHDYCAMGTGTNPAETFCIDAGGSHPVCLGYCDGEGGADRGCPSGYSCGVPATTVFVVPQFDASGNPVTCTGDPADCPDAAYECMSLSSGQYCARSAKMCQQL